MKLPIKSKKEISVHEKREVLKSFLKRWPVDKIKSMSIDEYTGIKNKDTFCYWIEHIAWSLGSIRSGTPIKFGIYRRSDDNKGPQNKYRNEKYSWVKRFGETQEEAFENVKKAILSVIECAMIEKWEDIDSSQLSNMFRWKVAFIYSDSKIIPIYSETVIGRIGKFYNVKMKNKNDISSVQKKMMEVKPLEYDALEFMHELWGRFRDDLYEEQK